MKAATVRVLANVDVSLISIHAAREGGDETGAVRDIQRGISIHAAREGGDVDRKR